MLNNLKTRDKEILSLEINNFYMKQTKSSHTNKPKYKRYTQNSTINYEEYYDNI